MVRKPAMVCGECESRNVVSDGVEIVYDSDYFGGTREEVIQYKCLDCGIRGDRYIFRKVYCREGGCGSGNTMWTSKLEFVCRDCEFKKLEERLDSL